jgi:hypothetical protein
VAIKEAHLSPENRENSFVLNIFPDALLNE